MRHSANDDKQCEQTKNTKSENLSLKTYCIQTKYSISFRKNNIQITNKDIKIKSITFNYHVNSNLTTKT